MRLTRAGEYAVRCVLYLSLLESRDVVNRKEIAKAMEIPDQFLGKIAKQLSQAGILEVVQGAHGGIRLARSPSEITLLEVIEAIIGEIFLNDCVLRSESCSRSSTCSVHRVWEKAKADLRATLNEYTFARLVQEENCFSHLSMQSHLSTQFRG